MRRALALGLALAAGLVVAWCVTLVGAELLRTLFGRYFDGTNWPAWFPTTPIVLATVVLWVIVARVIWRLASRRTDRSA